MNITWIDIPKYSDDRGSLIVFEAMKNVPFDIKRVYCLYGMSDMNRGRHAHKKLEQIIICLTGSCNITLDNGSEKRTLELHDNQQGILVGHMIWRELHNFSKNCVIMVLASDWFDQGDYIYNYDEFVRNIKNIN